MYGSVGLVFYIAGWFLANFPPKEINGLYGYRTARSMSSLERWNFAQKHSAGEMQRAGIILLILALLSYFLPLGFPWNLILFLVVLLGLVVWLVVRTENALKRQFPH